MRIGDLVWAPYRRRTRAGVVVGVGRKRYAVYILDAGRATWIGKADTLLRDCDAKSADEQQLRDYGATAAQPETGEASDDPRPLKAPAVVRGAF